MKTALVALLLALTALTCRAEAISAPLYAASFADPDGKAVALERYRGKPLIVNFWARWCAPCRAEIPELLRFRKELAGKAEILGIGIEDQGGAVRDFARANGIDYPLFLAGDDGIRLMQTLGNDRGGLPFTLFIDRHGRIVERKLGLLKRADLEAVQARLLAP